MRLSERTGYKKVIRSLLTIVLWIMATAVASTVALITLLFDRKTGAIEFIMNKWAKSILILAGVKIEVKGLEQLAQDESYIFISNHASLLDIPAVLTGLPFNLRFLVKKELFEIPLFGRALLMAGHIKIDRGNLESAVKSLRKGAITLKERGCSALVFAEGTRSLTGEVGRFKKGGIILALSMGIPIVPVSISGSRSLASKGDLKIKSGKITMTIGKPIPTEGMDVSDRNRLLEATRDEVIKNLVEEDAI